LGILANIEPKQDFVGQWPQAKFSITALVWIMARRAFALPGVLLAFFLAGCGGGEGTSGSGGETPQDIPTLSSIAPSSTTAGGSAVNLVLYGSNFENEATVAWNGTTLSSSWVSATQMTATIPSSDVASVGRAMVTVTNPSPGGGTSAAQTFSIVSPAPATTWVRSFLPNTGVQDIVWDVTHGVLYVSISSADSSSPNTIVTINPLTGTVSAPVPAGNNPDLLSISSDSSYLWVGLDGDHAVQRFLLPGLTKDISVPVPPDSVGNPQQPVSLQAAPASPQTLALIAGNWGYSPPGNGIYVFDNATQRPTSVPGYRVGGPMIDWIRWGANDSTIYGNQYTTIDAGGVATVNVASSGASLAGYNGGQVGPPYLTQFDANNGLLYSLGGAFFPANGSLVGTFNLPIGNGACTADPSLGRYYCFVSYPDGGTDVTLFELWVFDLNTYALIDRVYFGASAGQQLSPITGGPQNLVRWGNAGLALTTKVGAASGGVFLMDGAAVNPNVAPDVPLGSSTLNYSWLASLTPQQATVGNDDVTITINGNNFTQDSTACWNCNYLQFQYLPTSYVSAQQLSVTIPSNLMASPATLPISVFDASSNLFSSDSLTFTVVAASAPGNTTQVTPVDLAGFAMAWSSNAALLYVATADYDGSYPNSIVAINGQNGSIVSSQTVSPDPYLLSVSANGQYLYAAFASATTMTQLQLPGLGSPLTWTLNNPESSAVYWAGDMRAAPVSPDTTAVNLLNLDSEPDETGGVVIFDDSIERPDFLPGFGPSPTSYDTLAWGLSDEILTGAPGGGDGPLSEFQISPSGATLLAAGTAPFNNGEIHSDFGTGLIYSDDGNVADPTTQAVVGSYGASGLVAPDSTLDRVFVLGQTEAQTNTSNFTIDSFDEKAYTPISSITLDNLLGSPIELVRWGSSGLAILTINQGGSGSQGMLYLIQDTTFVSNAQAAPSRFSKPRELVQQRWKRVTKADIFRMVQAKRAAMLR